MFTLDEKKIKEIRDYAKGDVKYFVLESNKSKERGKDSELSFKLQYPKGITSYYESMINITKNRTERLKSKFGYTDEMLEHRAGVYHEAFWPSWTWWNNKLLEMDLVMAKYKPIFKEAEEFAKKVDVSDIQDGFPCGMAVLYLKPEAKNTDLGKTLRLMSDNDSYSAKVCHWSAYKLPIRLPNYGQCMTFDERVCEATAEFLNSKGINAGVYTMID